MRIAAGELPPPVDTNETRQAGPGCCGRLPDVLLGTPSDMECPRSRRPALPLRRCSSWLSGPSFGARPCRLPKSCAALGRDLVVLGLMILAVLNLRADVWVAASYGVTVAEAHNLQPIWIIPVLTIAGIAWTALVTALTKPSPEV